MHLFLFVFCKQSVLFSEDWGNGGLLKSYESLNAYNIYCMGFRTNNCWESAALL